MAGWTCSYLPREIAITMRSAENEAKRAQIRLRKGWMPPSIEVITELY